ncbi:MAG: double-strand break repair protein AddB [Rhizobiaceae bacterium]|nr:double-strand break repair protein AddB [Rhizobiaceae bacterium]
MKSTDKRVHVLGNVFSVHPGSDFLHALVDAILDGVLVEGFCPSKDPFKLADATIYVPNRRAARALSSAFLARFEGSATLLPTIRTLGDTDDDEFGIDVDVEEFAALPTSISALDRTLQLAMLIQTWKDTLASNIQKLFGDETILIPTSSADSIRLADDLANLLTQIVQEETDWNTVNELVPDEYADWWRLTAEFLKIIMNYWPEHLKENDLMDPAVRAVSLLRARAERYESKPPKGPVIVAGTTGSVPSTQLLLRVVGNLLDGAIVLPGVDMGMSNEAWNRLQNSRLSDDPLIESHPQFGLARTIRFLGIDRSNIVELGNTSQHLKLRSDLVSTALALSDFSADWHLNLDATTPKDRSKAFEKTALIEAVNERQEALAIAIAMREVLEDETSNAALVTPDRSLAQRVSMELLRFGVSVDDSAGIPLINTPAGVFVRNIMKVAQDTPSHPDITALLKNPLCLAGRTSEKAEAFARIFELLCLRGSIHTPRAGAYLEFFINRKRELLGNPRTATKVEYLDEQFIADLEDWLETIDKIFSPVIELKPATTLFDVSNALRQAAIALATGEDGKTALALTRGSNELDAFFQELLTGRSGDYAVNFEEVPDILDALLSGRVSRTGGNTHPRLHIYGPLEVRLLKHDRVILAGLNEDTWPQNSRSDAFLNRTLRRQLNMPSPERRTGLAAHDFQQLSGAKEVFYSRAGRVDKSPTVASRWLQRLTALLGEDLTATIKSRGNRYVEYANALDASTKHGERAKRPNEKPPLEARPRGLPVTDIETWIRDPYALYAKRILKLSPIEPLEREADHLLKGTLYHAILENYVKTDGPCLPVTQRLSHLIDIASQAIKEQQLPADIERVWVLRFAEIAKAYVEWETEYQASVQCKAILTEIEGETKIGETEFTLRARADRIDVLKSGDINLFDYKTGGSPSKDQARTLSPQLALEALIAQRGGFEGLVSSHVADMKYLRLRTGEKIGAEKIADAKNPIDEIVLRASDNLQELVTAYSNPDQGYISRYAPFKDSEMSGDYDHLARVREWSFGEEDSDD